MARAPQPSVAQPSVAGSASGSAARPAGEVSRDALVRRSLPFVISFAATELRIPRPLSNPVWGGRIGRGARGVSREALTRSCWKGDLSGESTTEIRTASPRATGRESATSSSGCGSAPASAVSTASCAEASASGPPCTSCAICLRVFPCGRRSRQ